MNKVAHPIFVKSIIGLALCFSLCIYLYYRATKNKAAFFQIQGRVEYVEDIYPLGSKNNPGKYRYLKVDGYSRPFELFVGKDFGDFKPAVEKLDSLKSGDTVTVFYDEDRFSQQSKVNRLAYFIEKDRENFFVKGSWEKYMAFLGVGFCAIMLTWLLRLKRRGKIV